MFFKKKVTNNDYHKRTYNKNRLSENDKRRIHVALVVENGVDWGVSGEVPGYLINELDDVIEKIARYVDEN